MNIRPYQAKDKENVRFVCLNSDGPCTDPERVVNFLLAVYCDYYIENEPENCFVAADENDKAVGYIICAENFDKFFPVFLDKYCSKIDEADADLKKYALSSVEVHEKYKEDYPAHLHIDLLPEYQHMGLGRKLMDALCDKLRSKNVRGVMFNVWSNNHNAIKFYEKYGFKHIETKDTTFAYGLKL